MPYQRKSQRLVRRRLMRTLQTGAPMLSALIAAGCEQDSDGERGPTDTFSNPKGSIYEMSVPEPQPDVGPPRDQQPPAFDSNPKGSLYDEGFPDEGVVSSNPKGSLYDLGVSDQAPADGNVSASDSGERADAGETVEVDAASPKSAEAGGASR